MKKYMATFLLSVSCFLSNGQDQALELTANFSAIIVSDIDTTIEWYGEKLGFQVVDRIDLPERGLKQANLQRGSLRLELIELAQTLAIDNVLADEPRGTKVEGFFKIGFSVTDFDKWVEDLESKNAEFHGSVVNDKISGKRMVIIRDPSGNRIQLFEE